MAVSGGLVVGAIVEFFGNSGFQREHLVFTGLFIYTNFTVDTLKISSKIISSNRVR